MGCSGEYSQEDPGSAEDSVKTSTELEIPAPQEPRSPSAKAFLAKKGQSLFFFFPADDSPLLITSSSNPKPDRIMESLG